LRNRENDKNGLFCQQLVGTCTKISKTFWEYLESKSVENQVYIETHFIWANFLGFLFSNCIAQMGVSGPFPPIKTMSKHTEVA
jgi:hypothetical protein